MRIERVIVRNFRNLANLDLSLASRTVVVGENRSGKSNLLHAIRLVLDPTMPNSDRRLGRADFWDGLSDGHEGWDPIAAGQSIEISLEIGEFDDDPDAVAVLAGALLEGEPMRAKLTYLWAPSHSLSDDEAPTRPYQWRVVGGTGETRVPVDLRERLAMTFLHALRDVEADIRSWRRSPLRTLLDAAAEATQETSNELDDVRTAMNDANRYLSELDSISHLGAQITTRTNEMVGPAHALDTTLAAAPPDPLRLIRGMRIFVDGAAQRELNTASLGTLNVLYLALLELGLEQRLKTSDAVHVVVAAEEPEAHLHPHLQRVIFRRLLGNEPDNRTILVTTQSPHIVSVANPKQLIALRTVGNQTKAFVAGEAALSEAEWADVERYLDATRAELVFARRALLVEGFAEQVMLPPLASSRGMDLDKLGVSVCAIHGTHFGSYASFCQAFGIPFAVLTDGDPDEKGDRRGVTRGRHLLNKLGLAGEDLESHGIFVGDSTFEYDLFRTSKVNQHAIAVALRELTDSASHRSRLDSWTSTTPDQKSVIDLIKAAGGKGRLAQRLARITLDVPPYIGRSLRYLGDQ